MHSVNKFNLKSLLEEYYVKIPAVQRDFAFGRVGNQNNSKRVKFISDLMTSLVNKNLHLDFIYGIIENGTFIPLDGQQRLTILWLIEVYLTKYHRNTPVNQYLSKFTYDTRASTREFCKELLENDWDLTNLLTENLSVTDYFYRRKWFFNSWRYDPTISGMIVVLDEIHKRYKSEEESLKHISLSTDNVTFSFLNLEQFGNPEDLYVKMNSRGKELSKWDVFKVELFELLSKKFRDLLDVKEFEVWIDGPLVDYFWKLEISSDDKSKLTEIRILRLFYYFIYLEILEKELPFGSNDEVQIHLENNWKDIITVPFLREVQNFINYLNINNTAISKIPYLRFDIDGLRYQDLINILKKTDLDKFLGDIDLFYAYKSFIKKTTKNGESLVPITETDKKELMQIIRIITNFEESYRKQFTIEYPFIKSIKPAIFNTEGIINYFSTLSSDTSGFGANSEEQLGEEIIKAKLLIENSLWEEKFCLAEKHPLLNGTIGWLIRLSNNDIQKFDHYKELFFSKFDENGIKDELEIAKMLKYFDIRDKNNNFPRNAKHTINNFERDYSWKHFFRLLGYKKNPTDDHIIDDLRNFFDNKDIDNSALENWRLWAINYPEILKSIGGIKINDYENNRVFGIQQNVVRYSSTKYDIPLYVAREYIESLDYKGYKVEGEPATANYKKVTIGFDYLKNEYILEHKHSKYRIDCNNITKAVEILKIKLDEILRV